MSLAAIGLAVGALGAVPALAEVGGPPSNDLDRCERPATDCGTEYVLAEGEQFDGPREIVGFSSSRGPCLSFEAVSEAFFPLPGCDERVTPTPKRVLRVELSVAFHGGGSGSSTEIGGVVRPDVAGIRVRYPRRGRTRIVEPVFAQVSRDLSREIGFKRRVGVFDVVLRGRVKPRRVRLRAFDSDGRLLGTRLGEPFAESRLER